MDNSGGGQVWVESKRWGPLDGQMLHLSYGQCRLLLTLMEEVNGVYQGGSIKFPTVPDDFESGIMRGRFNPHDGQLYVSGLRGWQTRAVRDGCFQRLRYTGGPVHLPTAVRTYKNGIKLTFPESLDREMAENVDNYFVEQWNYRWTAQYGSPDFSVKNPQQQGRDEVPVVSATLMDGGQAIFLEMPGRQPVNQISISWLLDSTSGEHVRGRYAHTINVDPAAVMPEDQIIRRKRPLRIAPEIQQRLKPGLLFRFDSRTGKIDARISRMMTLYQSTSQSPTPFLKAGPFGLEATGTVRIPLSGFYGFKVTGTGKAQLWVNDVLIVDQEVSSQTEDPILLHKGHNLVRLRYTSPEQGVGQLRVWWKGFKFDWEPVPGDVFFHDSGDRDLVAAHQRRAGRNLFADHHCAKCHQTGGGQRGMFELGLAAPNLATAGDRLQASWLQQWLLDPQLLRPGAHMPELLSAGQTGQRESADLAAYLLQQRAEKRPAEPAEAPASALATGQLLFETLGCINCHHFGAPGKKDEFDRLSLHHANAKYRAGAMVQFLLKPSAHFEATRMPNFHLSADESVALAQFVRSKSPGKIAGQSATGSAARGEKLFTQKACLQCHRIGGQQATKPAQLKWAEAVERSGCLASKGSRRKAGVPAFDFSEAQQRSLHSFLQRDLASLQQSSPVETSGRLFERLQCASCHDRDGQRSKRLIVLVEEGGGKVGKVLPQLTWAGEKLQPSWTEQLLSGTLPYKSRPWIKERMPAFPGYAKALSEGLAIEHAINPYEREPITPDPELVAVGQKLTLQTGLDCRQCHGIGDLQPRGDKNTKISQGVNFTYIRDRLRYESYQRFMFDPPRFDINTNMIKLSANGITTKVKQYYDADAHRQFEALWHYIHSLPAAADR
ncbi:MAG TPA: c-type cytochrome, partial [Planctomycetaceae bacterium]|nr:c-type cytochrome [Planctomycetaceae bacterium]